MKIRQATLKDNKDIVKFARRIIIQHQNFNAGRFEVNEDLLDKLDKLYDVALRNPQARIFVAESQGAIHGYVYLQIETPRLIDLSFGWAWIYDLYLDEFARGKGVGKALMKAAIEAAKEMGVRTLMLQTAEQNAYARSLFGKLGFEVVTREMMLKIA